MIQQSHAPMDIGEVEGAVEGSHDEIDELRGTRKTRRDERSTYQKGYDHQIHIVVWRFWGTTRL